MGTNDQRITAAQVRAARKAFEANGPRDLFCRAATELVDLALKKSTSLTVAEALAVLLQTWNREYYRFRRFDTQHFTDIENLLVKHGETLGRYRHATIEELREEEKGTVWSVFQSFEAGLGPVGAAKALHLLARRLFPLWDRRIAQAYGFPLGRAGFNGERYWKFMSVARSQCLALQGQVAGNPLKAVDEYNYCKHSRGWL